MNRTIAQRLFWFILLGIVCFVVLYPLFRPGLIVTDDGDWMVIRLSAFYQSFREGQFPVRFLGRLNYSYGYPVANFLYPGFLYIGSVLHGVGLPFQVVTEVIMIGSIAGGAIALFFWLRHFFDERASSFGVASFLFMPYLLYDVFKRGSVGEIIAIGLCLVSLYAIESKKRWLISPAVAMLAVSHNTLAMFFIPVLLGYILVKRYWEVTVPFMIGVGMSAFFWLPAFFDRNTVLFDTVTVSNPAVYFPASLSLIAQGLPFLIVALAYMMYREKTKLHNERWYFFVLLFGSAFLALPISSWIWQNTTFAKFIQFPYRLLALWCFPGPWFVASLAHTKKDTKRLALAFTAIFILFMISLPYQSSESIVRPEGFFTTNEGTTTVANEYMPKWVSTLPNQRASKRIELYKGNAEIVERRVTTEKIDVVVQAKEESIIQVNTVYYPGWGAIVDNKFAVISYDNPGGLMRVVIPVGSHRLFMAFRETGKRFLADIVSGIFFIFYIVLFVAPPVIKKWSLLFMRHK